MIPLRNLFLSRFLYGSPAEEQSVVALNVQSMRIDAKSRLSRLSAARACGAALALVCIPGWGTESSVAWTDGRLWVRTGGQPLATVLREVEAATGIRVKGAAGLKDPVLSGINGAPLVEGLRRLLDGHSFMIIEGTRHTATRVLVVGGAVSGDDNPHAVIPRVAPRGASAARETADPATERPLADSDPAVRIEAVERLGDRNDERSLLLLKGAMSDPSEAVRAVAQQALDARRHGAAGVRAGLTK